MKKLIIFLIVAVSANFAFAGADPGYISCVNGDIWDVGDSHFQVDIHEQGLAFYLYETSFTLKNSELELLTNKYGSVDKIVYWYEEPSLKASELDSVPNKYRFVNKTVEMSSEGQQFTGTASGLVVLSQDQKSATVDLSTNDKELWVHKLKCTKKEK